MSLYRLVYLSDAVKRFKKAELSALVDGCRKANADRGISGLLLYSSGSFMQVLEGDQAEVTSLYAKIERDPRHKNVRTLLFKSAQRRLFPDWGMNLALGERATGIDRDAVDKALHQLRLAEGDTQATEKQALTLLQEFRRQLMRNAA